MQLEEQENYSGAHAQVTMVVITVQSDTRFRALRGLQKRKNPTRRGDGSNDFFRFSCFVPTISLV